MQPSDLSLPSTFPEWRRYQEDAIISAVCSDRRFRIIQAPPGVGKSAIYMGIASILGRTLVQTYTKALQAQLMRDFHTMGLREIKGQVNYPCLFFKDQVEPGKALPGCDEGPCHAKIQCDLKIAGCHYYDAVREASRSGLVVTNYHYRMSMQRYAEPGAMGHFDCLILDEAHEAREALADFSRISISRGEVKDLLDLKMLRQADMDAWVEWAREIARPAAYGRLEYAQDHVQVGRHWVDVVRRLNRLYNSLNDLAQAKGWHRTDAPDPPAWVPGTDTDWIVEETDGRITFQPVWAGGYAQEYLYGGAKNVILTSATITERDAKYLGIEEYDFFTYSSPFASSTRPLYVAQTAAVGAKMSAGEERIWLRRIDQIIEKELNEGAGRWDRGPNGIIHTVSYARARRIAEKSAYRHLMMTHTGYTLHATVERFKAAKGPVILVSPSVATGFDFKGDAARWQIIAKIPFIDSRPPLIRARAKSDKAYLNHVALVALIQTVGRGVRSENDYCRSWLVDDNWRWFERANKQDIPKWFKRAIKKVRSILDVPPPKYRGSKGMGGPGAQNRRIDSQETPVVG